VGLELTTLVVIGTDCTGSCKSIDHDGSYYTDTFALNVKTHLKIMLNISKGLSESNAITKRKRITDKQWPKTHYMERKSKTKPTEIL
jgi:hypothetical protein